MTAVKYEGETKAVSFDFTSMLAIGETLTSQVVTAAVFQGEDSAPEDLIDGSATASGAVVSQMITGGVVGVVYVLSCAVETSNSQDLLMNELVAVISNNPFQ
jgi:hypothetical protein